MDQAHHTAYCGLFCPDCIRSNETLFRTVDEFRRQLRELRFSSYADMKASTGEDFRVDTFRDYPVFEQVLQAIADLRCAAPCRDEECVPNCQVRRCVLERGQLGCWECSDFRTCDILQPLRDFHGEAINHNLAIIKQYGPSGWSHKRAKPYPRAIASKQVE